jgi:uncharacterized protein YceK
MRRLIFLMVTGALVVSGCGSTSEKKINVQLMKSDPPMGCQMVGDVQAKGDDMNEAKNELRLKADEQGGNYVRLDALDMSGGDAIAAGAAFNCQRSGSAETIESPPKSKPE